MTDATIGKSYLVVATLIGWLFILIAISLPLYLLGALFIWRSDLDKSAKRNWLIAPVILSIIGHLFFGLIIILS